MPQEKEKKRKKELDKRENDKNTSRAEENMPKVCEDCSEHPEELIKWV